MMVVGDSDLIVMTDSGFRCAIIIITIGAKLCSEIRRQDPEACGSAAVLDTPGAERTRECWS